MFKYCPECKSKNLTFVENHFWKCGDCDFHYFHNTAAATAAIITYKDQLLMTVRAKDPKKGLKDLPGGFADYHESLEQGLTRELKEELQLEIPANAWRYFGSFPNNYEYKNIKYHTLDALFTYELSNRPYLRKEISEISDFIWVKLNTLDLNDVAFNSTKSALQKYVAGNFER